MFILLFVLWMLFNGRLMLDVAVAGVILSGALTAFSIRYLGYRPAYAVRFVRLLPRIAAYLVLLLREIVLSALHMTARIWSGREPEPTLVHLHPPLESGVTRVMLANSITLTPGTLTVSLEDGRYLIHRLYPCFAVDDEHNAFLPRLLGLEGRRYER